MQRKRQQLEHEAHDERDTRGVKPPCVGVDGAPLVRKLSVQIGDEAILRAAHEEALVAPCGILCQHDHLVGHVARRGPLDAAAIIMTTTAATAAIAAAAVGGTGQRPRV